MSMKSSLYMCMALAMMSGMGGTQQRFQEPRRYNPPPRKLTPEEEEAELKKRKDKFLSDLEQNNINRKKNFPSWKEYDVYGLKIVASNTKNAIRNMQSLMRENYISIES